MEIQLLLEGLQAWAESRLVAIPANKKQIIYTYGSNWYPPKKTKQKNIWLMEEMLYLLFFHEEGLEAPVVLLFFHLNSFY